MAKIMARMPVIADRTETTSSVSFANGLAVGKLVQVSVTPNVSDVKFYADDGIAEHNVSFTDAAISLNISTIPGEAASKMFGADTNTTDTIKWYDVPAKYVGFGFISAESIDNVQKFKVSWFPKVIFALPTEQYDTKGESITFNASTITGTAEKDPFNTDASGNEEWKEEYEFSTAAAAVTKLKALAGIT